MALGTLLAVALAAGVLAVWSPTFALVLLAGGAAGIANALLSMLGNERLLDRRNVPAFVLSSFPRLSKTPYNPSGVKKPMKNHANVQRD